MKKTKLGHFLEKLTIKAGTFIGNHAFLYYALNFTWGFFENFIGVLVFLCLLPMRLKQQKNASTKMVKSNLVFGARKIQNGIVYNWGFSLGVFYFTSAGAYNNIKMLQHEFGHSCQNAIFGPFYLFVVEIPSTIRYWHRLHLRKKRKVLTNKYDDIWFEGSASKIGQNVLIK